MHKHFNPRNLPTLRSLVHNTTQQIQLHRIMFGIQGVPEDKVFFNCVLWRAGSQYNKTRAVVRREGSVPAFHRNRLVDAFTQPTARSYATHSVFSPRMMTGFKRRYVSRCQPYDWNVDSCIIL